LGIGDWGLGPMPKPQNPIPNFEIIKIFIISIIKNKKID